MACSELEFCLYLLIEKFISFGVAIFSDLQNLHWSAGLPMACEPNLVFNRVV